MTTITTTTNGDTGALFKSLPQQHVEPLWTVVHNIATPKPAPKAAVNLWKFNDIRPLLMEAGKAVSAEEAERRVLMLTNPELKAPHTTDSVYAGLQLILPGETAPAHRHRAFALRFIIEGSGGFTAVEGQKVYMEEGDVVLTPRWHWHDHGHEGDGPMIWLDGLDIPMYHQLPTHFAEPYKELRYPSSTAKETPFRFKWNEMKDRLDRHNGNWALEHYVDAAGRYISDTLGAHAEKVVAGTKSPPRKDTCSYVYHAHVGSGKSTIKTPNGETKEVVWQKNDTFAVPAWSDIVHEADAGQDAYLFVLSDRPLLEELKLYTAEL